MNIYCYSFNYPQTYNDDRIECVTVCVIYTGGAGGRFLHIFVDGDGPPCTPSESDSIQIVEKPMKM